MITGTVTIVLAPWCQDTGPEGGTGGARRDACTSLYGPSDNIGVGLHHWSPVTPGFLCGHPTAKPTRGVGSNTEFRQRTQVDDARTEGSWGQTPQDAQCRIHHGCDHILLYRCFLNPTDNQQ
jgi:hypothetical protein